MKNRKISKEYKSNRYKLMCDCKVCQLCQMPEKLQVHHIIPYSLGGSDNIENLIAICGNCHRKLTPISQLLDANKNSTIKRIDTYKFYEKLDNLLKQRAIDVFDVLDIFDQMVY